MPFFYVYEYGELEKNLYARKPANEQSSLQTDYKLQPVKDP